MNKDICENLSAECNNCHESIKYKDMNDHYCYLKEKCKHENRVSML